MKKPDLAPRQIDAALGVCQYVVESTKELDLFENNPTKEMPYYNAMVALFGLDYANDELRDAKEIYNLKN